MPEDQAFFEDLAFQTIICVSIPASLAERDRKFRSFFGCSSYICSVIWNLFLCVPPPDPYLRPYHLLWTLLFLNVYGCENVLAGICKTTEKTYRKWVWFLLEFLAGINVVGCWILCLLSLILFKIVWENRKLGHQPGDHIYITVDGTDFRIYEPFPFNPMWFSHKFKGPGLRYEIGVSIKMARIVWVNGPFPCGSHPDNVIAEEGLHDELEEGERYIADGGYDAMYADTPSGVWTFHSRQEAYLRARHEGINKFFKQWGALKQVFRHELWKHEFVFKAIANITELIIEHESPVFELEFDENDLS